MKYQIIQDQKLVQNATLQLFPQDVASSQGGDLQLLVE